MQYTRRTCIILLAVTGLFLLFHKLNYRSVGAVLELVPHRVKPYATGGRVLGTHSVSIGDSHINVPRFSFTVDPVSQVFFGHCRSRRKSLFLSVTKSERSFFGSFRDNPSIEFLKQLFTGHSWSIMRITLGPVVAWREDSHRNIPSNTAAILDSEYDTSPSIFVSRNVQNGARLFLELFKLATHYTQLLKSGNCISSKDSSRTNLKNVFSNWRLVWSAVLGIISMFWGWLNVRTERRINSGLIAFIAGWGLWIYAVNGFVVWRYGLGCMLTICQ